MQNKSTVSRFSDRVANYVKFRPGYPAGVLGLFRDRMGLTASTVLADVGSGTAISSKLFVENGNVVYGVEPNEAMRVAAEEQMRQFPNFRSIDGTSEHTTLPAESVDFVIAAQAFHWFDPRPTRVEFHRILRKPGHIALIWNERQLESTAFLREYEQFLLKYGNDYKEVRHENINDKKLSAFFQSDYESASFENRQVHDLEGLTGRMLSASYMPNKADQRFTTMMDELNVLFEKHARQGKIEIIYDTNVYYSRV